MRYVSNMNSNLIISIFEFQERKSIVKIFCIEGVDGECCDLTEVAALFDFFASNSFCNFFRLVLNIFREAKWQIELCHDGVDLGFIFSCLAQNFDNLCLRLAIIFTPPGHFNNNFVAGFCSVDILCIDEKILMYLPKIWNNESVVRRNLDFSNEPV